MTNDQILKSDNEFKYMLLGRLQSDCYTWLQGGGSLWGINPKDHAETMVLIWNNLKIKPQWFKRKELKELSYRMTGKEV